ncbi:septum formation protein [Naumannella cuiyingiana]|uniref:Nucleoside triphosphate pyrophosphatase n=1 Tax=Naumannella cuiyingiana TaxID=1347891 RepID=A0A7Z0IK97_9ACTN|nr:Maf family protein [Naumannella cuiyingiana]NYI70222.1 septum formation protein [Naumannella cuiyingiana]
MRLVLASASPARLATLRRAGIEPEVIVSGVDETGIDAPTVPGLVGALARLKADAVHERLAAQRGPGDDEPLLIIGCDSLLEFDGESHGKPGDPAAVIERWRRLRGNSGTLHTGHALTLDDPSGRFGPPGVRRRDAVASTIVHFADADDAEIAAYAATGEPEAVAGAFTLDGLGGPLISGIEGDPHAVVGIGLPLLRTELAALGVAWPAFS